MNTLRRRILLLPALLGALTVCASLSGCAPPPGVKAAAAVMGQVESTISSVTSGTVKSEQIAELAFGAVGRVSRLNVQVGDTVVRNQIMAEVENDDLKTAFQTAAAEEARLANLYRSKSVAVSDWDHARSALELARIGYEKTIIRAPFDGQVVERNIEVGQLSQITAIVPKPLIRLVDLAPRYVQAEVDEVDLSKIQQGMEARIKVLAVRREPFPAKVRKLIPFISSIREQDRTSQIELTIDSGSVLLPVGASADVEVIVDRRQGVVMIPSRTVLGRGGDRYVFRLRDGKAVKTSIEIGIFNYDRTEVRSGLASGDVVLYPAESVELEDGMPVAAELQPWP